MSAGTGRERQAARTAVKAEESGKPRSAPPVPLGDLRPAPVDGGVAAWGSDAG